MTWNTIVACLPSNREFDKDVLVAIPQKENNGRKSFFRVTDFTLLTNGQIVLVLAEHPDYV